MAWLERNRLEGSNNVVILSLKEGAKDEKHPVKHKKLNKGPEV